MHFPDMQPQWELPPQDDGQPGILKIGPRKSQEIMRQLQTRVAKKDFPVSGGKCATLGIKSV